MAMIEDVSRVVSEEYLLSLNPPVVIPYQLAFAGAAAKRYKIILMHVETMSLECAALRLADAWL